MSINRRRLLKDHAALHSSPPPDFFLPTPPPPTDDLTTITINLLGPTSTPFEDGLFTIVLKLPQTYPSTPPKATFRTKIFHPNVDDRTGDVCVDTLKREWNDKLTLKDVCIVIRCLLVEPNSTSSLNEEAGRLVAEDWQSWERRARMWTKIHAGMPEEMKGIVEEVRKRDAGEDEKGPGEESSKDTATATAPVGTTTSNELPTLLTTPKKPAAAAVAKSAKKQKPTSSQITHKRNKSSSPAEAAPSLQQKPEVTTEKDTDKGKDKEKAIDAKENDTEGVIGENGEAENNSSGKENAGASTPSFSPTPATPAPQSRASSPVKQLPAMLPTSPPPESSAPTLAESNAPAPAAKQPPATTSLSGKKRPAEESLPHENNKVAKTTNSVNVKSSSASAASTLSTKSGKPGAAKQAANMAKGTTITMKKKPGAAGKGKEKEGRKGLKRF